MPNTLLAAGCVIGHVGLGVALWRSRRALAAARFAADRDSLTGLLTRDAANGLLLHLQRRRRPVGARLHARARRHGGAACRLGGDIAAQSAIRFRSASSDRDSDVDCGSWSGRKATIPHRSRPLPP